MPAGKHLNYYGFIGLFVALAVGGSYVLVNQKDCQVSDYDNLQIFHIVGAATGGVIFVLGFLDIASHLYNIKILFILAILAIALVGGLMFYSTYVAFVNPCVNVLDTAIDLGKRLFNDNSKDIKNNVFKAEDGPMIAVTILDGVAGLLLLSSASTFGRRV